MRLNASVVVIEVLSILPSYLYAQINIVGIVVLLLLLNNIKKSSLQEIATDQKIFNSIMVVNVLIFLFDTGMWISNGIARPAFVRLHYLSTTLYYICNPLICLQWLIYTDYKTYEDKQGLKKRLRFYAVPAATSAAISLVNPFTGWYFTIDSANNYARGPLFLLMAFSAIISIAIAFGITLRELYKNGLGINYSANIYLLILPIWVAIPTAIQILYYGVSVIWVCTMLAFVWIYIHKQNTELATDYLTGLFNRRRIDQYLHKKFRNKLNNICLFAIVLDLDKFKTINDQYGHSAGDRALIQAANTLRQACKGKDDLIARMGGDEFIIVGERTCDSEIPLLISVIHQVVEEYNKSPLEDIPIFFSIGYALYEEGDTVDCLLNKADRDMYRQKKLRERIKIKCKHQQS